MKKVFKIGEYAVGGIIIASIDENNDQITVKACAFNSPEIILQEKTFNANLSRSFYDVEDYLHDLTSSYYVEKIMDYILSHVLLRKI